MYVHPWLSQHTQISVTSSIVHICIYSTEQSLHIQALCTMQTYNLHNTSHTFPAPTWICMNDHKQEYTHSNSGYIHSVSGANAVQRNASLAKSTVKPRNGDAITVTAAAFSVNEIRTVMPRLFVHSTKQRGQMEHSSIQSSLRILLRLYLRDGKFLLSFCF